MRVAANGWLVAVSLERHVFPLWPSVQVGYIHTYNYYFTHNFSFHIHFTLVLFLRCFMCNYFFLGHYRILVVVILHFLLRGILRVLNLFFSLVLEVTLWFFLESGATMDIIFNFSHSIVVYFFQFTGVETKQYFYLYHFPLTQTVQKKYTY